MDKALRILEEWKEKILFGIVLIATILIALKARPLGGGISDIDAEVRAGTMSTAQADPTVAEKALRLLEKPTEITPTQPDAKDINRPFFDDRDIYSPPKASAWSLTQETYEGLPPLELQAPGFSAMHDFDVAAGARPSLSRVAAYVPRDNRRVELRATDE
ncbi:MAG: hypothetical protein IT464_00900 [Planctomycetes bacterium]|nr:hypothetical protein [Planctomycetota bacterium]